MSKNLFSGHNDKSLAQLQRHVETLVANEKGLIPDTFTKNGKRITRSKLPWMLPIWEKSLAMINEEVQSRLAINNNQTLFA